MIPEVRVTARFDDEKLALLKQSLKSVGQITPIICCQVEDELVLVDGVHRLNEAIKNKVRSIEVVVDEGDMKKVLMRNIFLDHLRGKTPVSEMRKVILALYEEEKATIEEIVEGTGLSRDYIEKLLIISELTPMCLEALDEERIGVGHAFALTKVKDPARQEMILQQLLTYHWTIKQLEDYITEVERIVAERGEVVAQEGLQPTPTVKCRFCQQEYDPAQVASLIICQSCSAIMYEAIALAKIEAERGAASLSTTTEAPKQ
jgi:ParB/RepB/Spo0J family partition protein